MSIDTIKKMMGGPGTTGVGRTMDKLYGRPGKGAKANKKGGRKGKRDGYGIERYMGGGKKIAL